MPSLEIHQPTPGVWDELVAPAADTNDDDRPFDERADVLDAIAQAVSLPRRFPRRSSSSHQPESVHVAEWLEEAQVEPLRAVLEPLVAHALRCSTTGRTTASERYVDRRVSGWAVFDLLADCVERPEQLLEVDVEDAVWSFDAGDDGRFEQWSKTVFVPAAGFAARVGDVMLHGDPIAPGLGSSNVLIGGRPALRSCDSHVCTRAMPDPHAGAGFVATYGKVEINGFPALRVGDYVDEGPHGLNAIAVGCSSVVIGPTPPPVECWRADDTKPVRRPEGYPFRWRRGELGPRERTQVLGLELDGPLARVEGTAKAAGLWAEVEHEDEQQ